MKEDDTRGGKTIEVIGVLPFRATGKSTTFLLERSVGISESIGSDRKV